MIRIFYSKIIPVDLANGPDVRVSLFVSGCRNRCKGCFNPEAWDFNYGQEFTWETLHEIERLLQNPYIKGLSILGGDPFEPENIKWVEILCAYVKHNTINKDIWVWSGYSLDDVWEEHALKYIDVLVDGRFEEDKKDLTLKWRGSSNQRVIDIQESLRTGGTVLWCE